MLHKIRNQLTPLCLIGVIACLHATAGAEEIGLLELFNYYEYSDNLASSGQPTREQLPAIKAAGIEAVVNLAPVTDPGAIPEEGELFSALGIEYQHIPVDWEAPPLKDVKAFFDTMSSFHGKKILVHCYANARASAFVYLWRTHKLGDSGPEPRATMEKIWAHNEGYEFPNVPQWQALVKAAAARDW